MVASLASAILLFLETFKFSLAKKKLPFMVAIFGDVFLQHSNMMEQWTKLSLTHVGEKKTSLDYDVSMMLPHREEAEMEVQKKRLSWTVLQLKSIVLLVFLSTFELKKKDLSLLFFGYFAEKLHHLNLDHLVLSSLLLDFLFLYSEIKLRRIFKRISFLKIQKAFFFYSSHFFPKKHCSQTLPTKNRTLIVYTSVCVCMSVFVCELYVIYTQHCKHT